MRTQTWRPGTEPELDQLFHSLRDLQYRDTSHKYHSNYHQSHFSDCVAFTIYFDDTDTPELLSSISQRSCWPSTAYRLLNRSWKPRRTNRYLRRISDCMGHSALDQVRWLQANTDCALAFISRQTDNWEHWVRDHFEQQWGLVFTVAPDKYLTCVQEKDDSCWQRIIYQGDSSILQNWKSR